MLLLSLIFVPIEEDHQLVSIRDGSGMYGSFFLGTGTIQDRQYYIFYTKDGEGFRPQKVSWDNGSVKIFEENRTDGTLHITYQKSALAPYWAMPIKCGFRYEFHIPTGTINKTFRLE